MLDEILQEICIADEGKRPRLIYKASQKFDDLMLEYEIVPDHAFNFITNLFANETIQQSHGIEHFLLEINVDFCKYTEMQKEAFLITLTNYSGMFRDKFCRHSIGDFIARAYPPRTAYNALYFFSKGSENEKYIAFVGFDVLRVRIEKNDPIFTDVISSWNALAAPGENG